MSRDYGRCRRSKGVILKQETEVGLCATCIHVRVLRSDRGSIFYQCALAATDPRFRKYPALPVIRCIGYERRAEQAAEK